MSNPTPFQLSLETVEIPQLSEMSYREAHEWFAREATYKTLKRSGFDTEKAERLAGAVEGTARQRVSKIMG